MRRNSGAYTSSPGTPEYGDSRFGKGWSSERVALPSNISRRHVTSTALLPFNSGRSVPSKWDDAERWITSPVSSLGFDSARPKSKSGPLGPTGGNVIRNYMANSPLTTGVFVPDGLSVHYESEVDARSSASLYDENKTTRVNGLSGFLGVPSPRDDGGKEEILGRRNMATQDDVRDVQVDKGTTTCKNQMEATDLDDDAWDVVRPSKTKTKEEAKIDAWENLQKAKAEAAIRKLEMKLEKKRSASMERISNKLRGAQMKAQAMRNRTSSPSRNRNSHPRRLYFRNIFSISCCFSCTNTH